MTAFNIRALLAKASFLQFAIEVGRLCAMRDDPSALHP